MVDVQISGEADLRRLAADLYQAGLVPELRREFEKVGRPMEAGIHRRIGEIPAKGPKHTGLRRALDKATSMTVTVVQGVWPDVRLRVGTYAKKMPAKQRGMPTSMNKRRFRHPVYGNRNVWVNQRGYPFFVPTRKQRLDITRAAIDRAVATVARKLNRKG
jgi:hypothetical protein